MKNVINLDNRDYHMHSSDFSDGSSSIDEIITFAGTIGMTEIAITDHSQAMLNFLREKYQIYKNGARYALGVYKNVFNDINVIFGVEGDLLNEEGDACFDIQTFESGFSILSAHRDVYVGDPNNITSATIKAIEKYHEKIKFIAHPCDNSNFGKYYDIEKLVEVANQYHVPLEFNAKNLYKGKTNIEKLRYMLKYAEQVYINSDAHSLWELKEMRKFAIEYLNHNTDIWEK